MKSAAETSLGEGRHTKDNKNYRQNNLERIEAAKYHAVEDTSQCSQEEMSPKKAHMEFPGK